jgi:membrane protease YdiL (CAAX protease family)
VATVWIERAGRRSASWTLVTIGLATCVLAGEVAVARWGTLPGAVIEGAAMLGLVNAAMLADDDRVARALGAIALVPAMRILSLAMPLGAVDRLWWPLLVGVPLLATLMLAGRALDLTPAGVGLRGGDARRQVAIAAAGLPAGLAAYALIRPEAPEGAPATLALAALVFLPCGAITEELLFRGILQCTVGDAFPRLGIALPSVLYAGVYLGTGSAGYVSAQLLAGIALGYTVSRTGRLTGAVGAHWLSTAGLLIVWPVLLG